MTALPVWLLDVDGVLNAISKNPDGNVWPADQWVRTKARAGSREWPILVATPVLDFIRQVHQEKRAEIWWHTTWQENAKNLADVLDLPYFPVRPAPEFHELRKGWWKLPAALRVVEDEGRPLVWTDDDAGNSWDLPKADRDRLVAAAPTLIVAPSVTTGLTPKHLRQIDAFLDTHGGAS